MSIVPLTEPLFLATVPISFGQSWEVRVYERGTYDAEAKTGTAATVYDSEAGTSELAQPLITDRSGRPRGASETLGWVEGASYDLVYSNPERSDQAPVVVPWEAAKGGGGELPGASVGVIFHGSDAGTARGTELPHYIWVGSVEPSNMDPDADLFIDTNGLSAEDIEGLGDAAGLDVGTAAGTVAAGDDSRITGAQQKSEKGEANGYAGLEAAGKVPASQLPSAVMEYQGTWNASTNSPKLEDGKGSAGDVYRVSVAAERNLGSGTIDFKVGDYAVYNGTAWEKSDTTDAVASVAGKTGAVTLAVADVSGAASTTELGAEKTSREAADSAEKSARETADGERQKTSEKGNANGYASLDAGGKVPVSQLPSNLGPIFPAANYTTGIGSNAPGAKAMCFVPVKILQTVTLTGVTYETGGTKNGKAIGALYDATGKRIAKSASQEQANSEFFQRLPFEAPIEVPPGVYYIGLIVETATGTFMGAYQMSPWLKATQAEFATPGEFAVPTELNNTGAKAPFVATY